jgi:hypothetical protein
MSRKLAFLIAAEVLVVAALGVATWHLVQSRLRPVPPVAVFPVPDATAPASPTASGARAPAALPVRPKPPTPGLSTEPAFLRGEAERINREQSAWQQVEWRAIQAVTRFARAYLEAVVLPAVEAAAASPRPPPPAPSG